MRTRDEIEKAAGNRSPFSNGEIGYSWEWENCAICRHDAPYRAGRSSTGCPIFTVALVADKTPAEWTEGKSRRIQDYTCSEFEAVRDGA